MSDLMLTGVLRMPLPDDPTDLDVVTWLQVRDRMLEAADELDRLRDEAMCARETLDAWFDRRKLGNEAVDQAVVDAASGYLRTSRVGGMDNEESDLILGVIKDMARLGLFADLFARAALQRDTE